LLLLMSFAQQDGAPGSARQWKTRSNPTTPRAGDAFESESRKVQDAVQKIQRHAGEVRKEANLLSTAPAHGMAKGKEKAQTAVREAKSTTETALAALQGLARATTGGVDGVALSLDEQNSRKFMHQKLNDNISASVKALDQAWMAYQAAEAEALRTHAANKAAEARTHAANQAAEAEALRQAAPSTMSTPLVSAGTPGMDPALPPAAADLEAGQQSQAQALEEDMMPAEAEMHAAIAEEYARDLTNLNQNAQMLQRAMVDLAETTVAQGSILENIESNMSEAEQQTTQANVELAATAQTQRSGAKRFMWLLLVAGSIAAVGAIFT